MIHIPQKEIPSPEDIYETILERSPLPLPAFEDYIQDKARKRASRIYDYLLEREDRLKEDCIQCHQKKARFSQTRYAYDTPWEDESREMHFCSDECGDSYMYEEPWAYFWCDRCDREISEQHPYNGWQIQYRYYDGEQICLRCYEKAILEDGVERDKLESGRIPGMFFSHGNTEPKQAGYEEVSGFRSYHVRDEESAYQFRKKALELMDQGKKVVIGYERLAYAAGEGYVTLMVKE